MGISFSGAAGEDIDVGNGTSLQIDGAETVMGWFWLPSGTPQNIDFFSKQTSSERGFSLQTDDDPPNDTWGIIHFAKTKNTMQNSGWTASPLPIETWFFLAGVFNPSTAIQIWVNSALSKEKTTGVMSSQYDPPNNVTIGGRPDGIANLNGKAADLRIYNRVLGAADIKKIYLGRGRDSVNDWVSRWPLFEQPSGVTVSGANSVRDLGLNNNHGTPGGSPVYTSTPLRGIRRR